MPLKGVLCAQEHKYTQSMNPAGIMKKIQFIWLNNQAVNSALMYAQVVCTRADTLIEKLLILTNPLDNILDEIILLVIKLLCFVKVFLLPLYSPNPDELDKLLFFTKFIFLAFTWFKQESYTLRDCYVFTPILSLHT